MKRLIVFVFLAISLFGVFITYEMFVKKSVNTFKDEFVAIPEDAKKVYFIHWSSFPKEIFNRFNEKNPNISVVFEHFDEDYYPTLQKTRIASGNNVDVMGVMEADYEEYAGRGYLVDLSEEYFLNNYRQDVRDAVRNLVRNKKEYAIAYRSSVYGIWYNKILFSKYNIPVPENYKDFLQVCGRFKQNGISPLILGARDDWAGSYIYFLRFLNLMEKDRSFPQNLENGKVKWTDPEVISAFKEISDFIAEGYLAEGSINLTYHQAFSEFTKGHAAMIITGDWSLNLTKGDTEKVCDPGVFPIPFNNEGKTKQVAGNKAGFLTGIFSESKHISEAKLLIEYLSTPEAAQIYSDITMSVPTIKRVDISSLKFNILWEPLRSMELISPGLTEMDHEMRKQFNKSSKDMIINSKNYLQILKELQALQDKLSAGKSG